MQNGNLKMAFTSSPGFLPPQYDVLLFWLFFMLWVGRGRWYDLRLIKLKALSM